jgi:DNA-directed RNA polymerase specialized sigma24 family protein
MRNFDGRPSKGVAQLLDKSDDAVRKLYSRAVASLAMRMNSGESP